MTFRSADAGDPGDGDGQSSEPDVGHVDELEIGDQIRARIQQVDAAFVFFYGMEAAHTERELDLLVDAWVPVVQQFGWPRFNKWIDLVWAFGTTAFIEGARFRRLQRADDGDGAQDEGTAPSDADTSPQDDDLPPEGPVGSRGARSRPRPSMEPEGTGSGDGPRPSLR